MRWYDSVSNSLDLNLPSITHSVAIKHYDYTVWKIQTFTNTQILREIKVGEFTVSKQAILSHFKSLNFEFHEFLHFFEG